jgi:hypothetical protein
MDGIITRNENNKIIIVEKNIWQNEMRGGGNVWFIAQSANESSGPYPSQRRWQYFLPSLLPPFHLFFTTCGTNKIGDEKRKKWVELVVVLLHF